MWVGGNNSEVRGFTLIEMLMAVAILGLGSFAILSLYVSTVAGLRVSEEINLATELAQERMEEVASLDFSTISDGVFPSEDFGEISEHPNFSRFVTIQEDMPSIGMKKVRVTAVWQSSVGGEDRQVVLETILTEEGAF